MNKFIGKTLYATIFLVLIPIGLWQWARLTADEIIYPALQSTWMGILLIGSGVLLILWSMYLLKTIGKGLPMNAFPPSTLVTSGPYHLLRHPIYVGFGILVLGLSIYFGSASGLWLVTPLTTLAMAALVKGYESIDLTKRFKNYSHKQTTLAFPKAVADTPDSRDRMVSFGWLISALILSHASTLFAAGKAIQLFSVFEFTDYKLSFIPLMALILLFTTVLSIQTKILLRQWLISGLLVVGGITFLNLFFMDIASQISSTFPQNIFMIYGALYLLCIQFLWSNRGKSWWLILCLLILLAFETYISSSPVQYLAVNALLYFLSSNHKSIWIFLRYTSEKIANSWKEWTFGNIRVINHGFYVGAGAFVGILQAGILGGDQYTYAVLIFAVLVTISAALWAQMVEGSEKLKRPFGYYGGIIGIALASVMVWLMGYNVWIIIGLFSVSMPWVQAIGRLRCLVNGCCHGAHTSNDLIGIRYFHYRSRVCHLSGAKGELLHPTQLYSILWLIPVGFILWALWRSQYPYPFIFGIYLILTSIGRFVEEAYRGEVQTKIVYGLRLYQWTALITCFVGIIMTTIHVPFENVNNEFGYKTITSAVIGAAFLTFAMGIDFPKSTARFSRLV